MKAYTFEQLAWFNRCLYPDDFADDLHKIGGMDANDAGLLKLSFRMHVKSTGKGLDIVGIYQEYAINDKEMQKSICLVIDYFLAGVA